VFASCVVDEDVEAAEGVDGEGDRRPDLVLLRHVGADEGGLALGRLDQPDRLGSAGFIEVIDGNGRASLAERTCDRAAGSARPGTGHEGDLASNLHGYAPNPSSAAATRRGSVLRL
jgi:hypothetical protein